MAGLVVEQIEGDEVTIHAWNALGVPVQIIVSIDEIRVDPLKTQRPRARIRYEAPRVIRVDYPGRSDE